MKTTRQADILGDCRNETLINEIFGSVSEFARIIEEKGNEFIYENIEVCYNPQTDIHMFIKGCEHRYREIETSPLGVVCVRCGHFVGAWEA